MNLVEATVKLLAEGFRDIDSQIEELYDELDEIVSCVDMFPPRDTLDYDFPEDIWEGEDELKAQAEKLQAKIKELYNTKQQVYQDEIKNLPQKTSKTEFDGFDITKTDPSIDEDFLEGNKNRNYVMQKYGYTDAYIAEMTPEEYLLLCGKYGWNKQFNSVEEIYKSMGNIDRDVIDEYAYRFKNGERAPLLVLDVKNREQEGRHRAFAAMQAGINTVPVLIKV